MLQPSTITFRGRSDSVESAESIDLGIKSERTAIHERGAAAPTKQTKTQVDGV